MQSATVFNFYRPEYSPNGVIFQHGLVSPEAQLATAPNLVSLATGGKVMFMRLCYYSMSNSPYRTNRGNEIYFTAGG